MTCKNFAIYTAGKWQLHGEKEPQPGAQTHDLRSNDLSAMRATILSMLLCLQTPYIQ